jgi:class 3 adenylate cyclase/TolB-like protein/Flp pilus assembly protein TadD
MREQRKLAAVLAADVVGYSRLMGRDEAGTLVRLKDHRAERLEPALARNGGRLVKLTGDGVLAEFGSAVDALRAAIEFQQAVDRANTALPEEQRIVFRIGLHVGDLIVDGDDLYGEGVNIAARLEGEAEPGGVVVSGALHEAASGKLQAAFVDLGRLSLKNIERPVQAYRIEWNRDRQQQSTTTAPSIDPGAVPQGKVSVIVLPFLCPGGTADQQAFADGITESLITDLSRQSALAVVARTTSLALRGKSLDVRDLARTMAVRYVVEGSVQLRGERLRVNVQLIAAHDGLHQWADRFDRELGDLLDLEDEIAERISRDLAVQVQEAEIRRAQEDARTSRDPSTLFLLGRRVFFSGLCRTNVMKAAALYADAVRLDDRMAVAHTALSIASSVTYLCRFSDTPERDLEDAVRHRDRALALDPALPYVQVASAWILMAEHKYPAAFATFERVARLAPLAGGNAFANLAMAKLNVGRVAEAEADLLRVIRVTPGDPQMDMWQYDLATIYLYQGKYAEAAEAARRSISINPEFDIPHIVLAAASVQLGQIEEARQAVRQAQALQTRWTVRNLKASVWSGIGVGVDDARMIALWDGLRSAGLPE